MERNSSLAYRLIPSFGDLIFVAVLCSLYFTAKSPLLSDGDTGYHIRAGELILSTGAVPRFDTFSQHSPPIPWIAHEWLSEVLMAATHQWFGMSGIVAASSFLLASTGYLLFRSLRSSPAGVLLAGAVTLLALASSQLHWLARPHLFSLLLLVLFHHMVESWHRERGNRLYLLPPLMLLWANLHGGFMAGFILLGAYLAGNLASLALAPASEREGLLGKLKQLSVATCACLAAALVNPYGFRLLLFPLQLASQGYLMDNVSEFMTPDFHGQLPFKYLLLLAVCVLALWRKGPEPTELLLVLGFGYMALYAVRYVPLFALVSAPVITRGVTEIAQRGGLPARALRERSERLSRIDARAGGIWSFAALLGVAAAVFYGRPSHAFDPGQKPVAACEFLMRQRISGNMFNSDEFGDYLIYRGFPNYRVFIDGRLDMYGSDRLREYNRVVHFEKGWESVLDKYRVNWILFETESRFARHLLQNKDWALVYSDPVASIFVKKVPEHERLRAQYQALQASSL